MRWLKLSLIRRGDRRAETQPCWQDISKVTQRLAPMLAVNDPQPVWRPADR